MTAYVFALVSQTSLVTPSELYQLKGALEVNAAHCAASWRVERPAIEVIDDLTKLPKGCRPVVFLESERDDGRLADHYFDPIEDGPAAHVYVGTKSSLNQGKDSVAEAASHEILEAMVNPRLNLWIDHPTRPGCQIAGEACDPVQDDYRVTSMGSEWHVSNFITPQYFDPRFYYVDNLQALIASGGGLDFLHRLRRPGDIGPEGYCVLRHPAPHGGWKTWAEDAHGELTQARRNSFRTRSLGVKLLSP